MCFVLLNTHTHGDLTWTSHNLRSSSNLDKLPLKCKPVKRGYAFELPGIPRDSNTEYLMVRWPAQVDLPPLDIAHDAFSHVFGLGSTIKERFLIDNGIMGPCWLQV